MDWKKANEFCKAKGSELASIKNQEENEYVKGKIKKMLQKTKMIYY